MAVSSERLACPSFFGSLHCGLRNPLDFLCARMLAFMRLCIFACVLACSFCLPFFLLTAFCLLVFSSSFFLAALQLLFAVLSRLCGLALHFDKCEALGAPAIKQIQIKRHSLFLGYVFFNEQIQGLLGFETMNR